MSQFDELINNLQTMEYEEKKQFLEYLVRIAERARHQLTQADKEALRQVLLKHRNLAAAKGKDTSFWEEELAKL